jgi:geranylgeranyl diphosphate synthase, type I
LPGLPAVFEKYRPAIEEEIKSLIQVKEFASIYKNNNTIYEMMSYHMGWSDANGRSVKSNGGKYLRATLTLLACESTGSDYKKALPAAAAIELIHNFSLVHDDIQDNDEVRRHKPTVWKIWGKPQAINVGNAMKILANLVVYNLFDKKIPPGNLVELLKILDQSSLKMIEGQFMDIDFETRFDITVEDYINMVERKTAALIECSLQIGAVLNLSIPEMKYFKSFGKNLGLAFQIKDDVLGIWGNDEKTGKPCGNDIMKKKKTYPVVYIISQMKNFVKRNKLLKIYTKKTITDSDMEKILMMLDEYKAREISNEKADMYYKMALDDLKKLPVKREKLKDYKSILNFLNDRDF